MKALGVASIESAQSWNGDAAQPAERWVAVGIWILVFVASFFLYAPKRSYFFGDSWGVLYELLTSWKTIFQPHNEHFVPLFKALYLLEYRAFGVTHVEFAAVSFALHATNSLLVFLVARRASLGRGQAAVAALIFAVNSAYWEVISWDFEQVFLLGTLFVLLATWHVLRWTRGRAFWLTSVFLLAGYFTAGLVTIAASFSLSVYYLHRLRNGAVRSEKERIAQRLGALWVPFVIYIVSFRAVISFTSVLAMNGANLGVRTLLPMLDRAIWGWIHGVVLPLAMLDYPQVEGTATVVVVIASSLIAYRYSKLPLTARPLYWLFLALSISPIAAIAIGRWQFGTAALVSSRYEYMPLAPFAIFVVLCAGGLFDSGNSSAGHYVRAFLGTLVVATLLIYHAKHVRRHNGAAERGQLAQIFVKRVSAEIVPASPRLRTSLLIPNIDIPDYLYAPGKLPLWQLFQVLQKSRARAVPVEAYAFSDPTVSGRFELVALKQWEPSGAARIVETNNRTMTVFLPQKGAGIAKEILNLCPSHQPPAIYTLALPTETSGTAQGRVILTDANGSKAETFAVSLLNQQGSRQWVVSAELTPAACEMKLEIETDSATPATVRVQQPVLIKYPAIVDSYGRLQPASKP